MQQKHIYIVLTRTTTMLSRFISYMSGDRYSHASIALDRELTMMYSFGRKWCHNPFVGGFRRENMDAGVFANCRVLPYAIVEIDVTPEQYDKACALIRAYTQNAKYYHYNYSGLLFASFGKVRKSDGRFYCSEFVYDLLRECEIICEAQPIAIRPQELIRYGRLIKEGNWKLDGGKIEINELTELHFI